MRLSQRSRLKICSSARHLCLGRSPLLFQYCETFVPITQQKKFEREAAAMHTSSGMSLWQRKVRSHLEEGEVALPAALHEYLQGAFRNRGRATDVTGGEVPNHPVVWEYLYQLGFKRRLIDVGFNQLAEIQRTAHIASMNQQRLSALAESISLDTVSKAPLSPSVFGLKYGKETATAVLVSKELENLAEMLDARDSFSREAGELDAENEKLLKQMADEDVEAATHRLLFAAAGTGSLVANELPPLWGDSSTPSSVLRILWNLIDDSEEIVGAHTWTLETLGRAGGVESAIFARELLEMYTEYFRQFLKMEVEDISSVDAHGGRLRITVPPQIIHDPDSKLNRCRLPHNLYSILRHEIGVHRVQRIPVTEAEGKLQTSTASVFVMPVISPEQVHVDVERDCIIDFVRGSGPGGQGMQSSSNCCVLTHTPSGITLKVHQTRSALGNRELAINLLTERLWKQQMSKTKRYTDSLLALQWTSGERGEKIRTYNFPQNRVTDHRLGTDYGLDAFMEPATGTVAMMHEKLVMQTHTEKLLPELSRRIKSIFTDQTIE